jgi:phosphatidylglycerophosphate synthase
MTAEASPDRRPIKTRDAAWARWLTTLFIRWRMTPNGISILGMLAGLAAGGCFASTTFEGYRIFGFIAGAIFVQLRLMANMFDGMVAIEGGTVSPVGELYNEIPDRVSDTATLVGCGYALGGFPLLGYWTTILAIFVAYIRASGRVAGAPQIYCGPMAKQHRMFVVTMAALISAILPQSLWFHSPSLGQCSWMAFALALILVGEIATIFRRLNRIQSAIWKQHNEAL